MKEKRQKRDDEHARSFSLPTGGVDVSQLTALGLPCPPPYNVGATNFGQLPGMTRHQPQYPMTSSPGHFSPALPYSAPFQMSPGFPQGHPFRVPYPYVKYSPSMLSPGLGKIPRAPESSGVWPKEVYGLIYWWTLMTRIYVIFHQHCQCFMCQICK